ncbi:hypothetical protein, partial [Acidovorax sp.]|uniref:hypothetical protein n=1 Tax=Acidovorax sp. TaxID=1872122 RepID=UPI0025C0096F
FIKPVWNSGQGIAQRALKQAHQAKRERVEHIPYLLHQLAWGLTDWHCARGGLWAERETLLLRRAERVRRS